MLALLSTPCAETHLCCPAIDAQLISNLHALVTKLTSTLTCVLHCRVLPPCWPTTPLCWPLLPVSTAWR